MSGKPAGSARTRLGPEAVGNRPAGATRTSRLRLGTSRLRLGRVRGAALAVLAAGALLTGCGSSDPDYYALRPWPGAAQPGGPDSLRLRTPSVAASLDRDAIVRDDGGYKLTLSRDAAWSEPLPDMIGRVLALDLQQRLPGTTVFTQSSALSADAQAVLELDVSRFARRDADGSAELDATLSVRPTEAVAATSRVLHLTQAPADGSVAALAATLSALLGQVADQAAQDARRIGPLPPS